jgi:hypothetical protein
MPPDDARIPPDRLVLLLESLQYLGWRILGSSTVKDGVRRIQNGKLDLLSRRVSSQRETSANAASSPAVTPAALMMLSFTATLASTRTAP